MRHSVLFCCVIFLFSRVGFFVLGQNRSNTMAQMINIAYPKPDLSGFLGKNSKIQIKLDSIPNIYELELFIS
jgi:hypothetical protein